jgi:hypothetical protein
MTLKARITAISATILFAVGAAFAGDGVWSRVETSRARSVRADVRGKPRTFKAFALNRGALQRLLRLAPEEFETGSLIVTVPMPDGTLGRFRIEHSLIVEPGLAAKFPELAATFRGVGIDDPTATIRFDLMQKGFHAMILRAGTTTYVDPAGDSDYYVAYEKTALPEPDEPFVCRTNENDLTGLLTAAESQSAAVAAPEVANGSTLRTYRLALAATGEYTAFTGGTVASALAAQVVSMNRVNAVYERELAIRMVIIANNDQIVYTNSSTDPYTNNNGSTMLTQNTTNLNNVIGTANFDIGHVFSTGGGGVAVLNGPCGGNKAKGVTGSPAPVGDGFDIDYVAHEMGHQFGAPHTFNGTTGNCGGGNRSGTSALEPGSGITIMAYAGICGAEDLALHSIDTFAVKSLEQISAFKEAAGNCGLASSTGNTPPTVTSPGNFTVPQQTPFALTATATDINGDTLTYDWQEYDFGAQAPPNTDADGQARPIFRSYNPTAGGTRYFPSLQYILNNDNVPPQTYNCGRTAACLTGEIMSALGRTMTFQVVVRDNRPNGGGIATATSQVSVTTSSGPFRVTAPNTGVTLAGNSSSLVTWSVNDTNVAPVSATNVDILLSTDGGLTFPTVLAASTPNDGSESVTLPNINTSTARIKVQGTGKIFFDISNANFAINAVAVSVTLSGRVMTSDGRGVKSARVVLTDPDGVSVTVATGARGVFSFPNVLGGRTYTVSVQSRRFQYAPQTVVVGSTNVTGILFQPI